MTSPDWPRLNDSSNRRSPFWEVLHEANAGKLKKQLEHTAQSDEVVPTIFLIHHRFTKRVACIQERRQALQGEDGSLLGRAVIRLDVTHETLAERQRSNTAQPLCARIVHRPAKLGDAFAGDQFARQRFRALGLRAQPALLVDGRANRTLRRRCMGDYLV